MITREKGIEIMKVVAKGTWNSLPAILSVIPATAIAGKVLVEVKKIADEAAKVGKNSEEIKEAVQKLVNDCGGENNFAKEVTEELKQNRDNTNPKYINCAIFTVNQGEVLTEEEQEKLASILLKEISLGDAKLDNFVKIFIEDYFAGDVCTCDNAYEIEAEYMAFNFDDTRDIEYNEEDLVYIRDEFNKILGRQVFDDYEGYGTDDSVNGYY